MNALRIHGSLRRLRRTTALIAVTCAFAGIVAMEHSGMPDMHGPEMAAFCLAVIPGAAFLMARGLVAGRLIWPRLGPVLKPPPILVPTTQAPLARAGPTNSLVLRL